MIKELAEQLSHGNNLTIDQMTSVMDEILTGTQNDEDVAEFLKNLTEKGESDDELLAMLNKMEEFALHISPNCQGKIIDVCGTGGDKLKTFNISTAASFVIAGAGGNVAKHGNRSISGVSGSADIFEYFGFDLNSEPSKVNEIIEKFGIGFMFAQKFHPAMKNVANARKVVGGRTAFNLLGPLTNPAMVKNQLIGVFSDDYQERIVKILQRKNAETIMTVRSDDGMDELSTTSKNKICLLKNNIITNMVIDPQDVGLQRGNISDIQINTKEDAIKSFVDVLNDTANKTKIEITALNAAGGLIVSDIADSFGGINLEDIKAPECFAIEKALIERCKIPVFHDDQHGTAIVTAAGMMNALDIQGKDIKQANIVCLGAGAAAIACMELLIKCGAQREKIYMLDTKGIVHTRRDDLNEYKKLFANNTDKRTLDDAIEGADVFVGVSGPDLLTQKQVQAMADKPIIFACSNPDPEIKPELALAARDDLIMATGRSDYPNQVNNVLCFPFIFRGALDVRARTINDAMKIAAVHAIRKLAKEPVPAEVLKVSCEEDLSFGKNYIIPKPMDSRLCGAVAKAVAQAAVDSGVAALEMPENYMA